jgi:hypothetical protein
METKRCYGPLHPPGGADIRLDDYTFNHTGPRAGKPLSRCKFCRSSGKPATIPSAIFMPIVEKLFDGRNISEVSQLTNLNRELLRDIKKGKRKRIYKNTFLSLNRAVADLPKEKVSIGPQSFKTKRNGYEKLTYEQRINLRHKVSDIQKERFKLDKKLLKHVV